MADKIDDKTEVESFEILDSSMKDKIQRLRDTAEIEALKHTLTMQRKKQEMELQSLDETNELEKLKLLIQKKQLVLQKVNLQKKIDKAREEPVLKEKPKKKADQGHLNNALNDCARNTNDTHRLKELVDEGADLTSTNGPDWRHTPMHQSAYHNRPDMVRTLIELCRAEGVLEQVLNMHSNPCGRGNTGIPLDLARHGGHHECARLIEEAMGGKSESKSVQLIRINLEHKLTWTELRDQAVAKGGRLPTKEEFKASGINNGDNDTWMPVLREDGRTDDWAQIGAHGGAHGQRYFSHTD